MKNLIFPLSLLMCTLMFIACGEDEPTHTDFAYSATVLSPTTDDKHVDDLINISVDFESGSQETVHHVNVRIYNKLDNALEIYNGPADAHVHETDGGFEFRDELMLSNANGVEAHTDWILEAKVWGHEAMAGEVIETVEFHVHPN